jgi:hypothetical protein
MPTPNETWLINQRAKISPASRDQVARDRANFRYRALELVSPMAPAIVTEAPPVIAPPPLPEEEA